MEHEDRILTSAPAVEEYLPRLTTTQVISHNIAQGHAYQHNGHVYGTLHVHVHQVVGADVLQVSDAIVSGNPRIPNGLLVPRQLAKRQGKNSREYSVKLRPGWASWFWRVTLQKSYRGWTANLRTFNLVPEDSLIHHLCRDGDLRGVQRLLARGEASALDITPSGRLPFHDAMESGNFKICRHLLSLTGLSRDIYPDRSLWLGFYLNCGPNSSTSTSIASYAFLEKLINTFGLDCDFLLESNSESLPCWTTCNNENCIRLMLNAVSIQYTRVAIQNRFANATLLLDRVVSRLRLGNDESFRLFLCALGCGPPHEELHKMRDWAGNSILHYIDQDMLDPSSVWRKSFKESLLGEFDLHCRNVDGMTPLMRMIASHDFLDSGFRRILQWLQLLQECNIDLVSYGRREAELFEPCHLWSNYHTMERYSQLDGLVYGSTPEDWDIRITARRRMELWRPVSMTVPGQWPADDANSPRILPWKPGDRDRPYLDPPRHSSKAWTSESINVLHEPTTVRKVMQDVAKIAAVRDQYLDNQDDHGFTCLHMDRESRLRHRRTLHSRRARSEPAVRPFFFDLGDLSGDHAIPPPLPSWRHRLRWHRCVADRRWKPGYFEPRNCLWQRCGLSDEAWSFYFESVLHNYSWMKRTIIAACNN